MEKFNFVIARYWPGTKQLCTYTFHNSEVHYGTQQDAEKFKAWAENATKNEYNIVKIGEING